MSANTKRNLARSMSTNSSRREIEKYIKFFTYKSLQIIVHSRSGDKSKTSSKANAVGVDWFNVALPGGNIESEIQKEIKNEFAKKTPVVQDPLWLNVYLKTAEDNDILLETWNIRFTDKIDSSIKNCFVVYNKLSMLIKSLIAVSRSLPGYQLTRKKDKDFAFYYKILSTPPSKDEMVELKEKAKIGSVGTMFGTVLISVFFKTNIQFDLSSVSRIRYKSEENKKIPIKTAKDDQQNMLSPLGPAAVEELTKAVLDDVVSSTASLPTSFSTASPHHFDLIQMQEGLAKMKIESISEPQSIGHIDDENRPLAAFVDVRCTGESDTSLPEIPSTPPFLSFIQGKIEESMIESPSSEKKELFKDQVFTEKLSNQKVTDLVDFEHTDGEPTAQAVGYEDDFVLVEVRPAFAPQFGDAGQLYRDCQNPPALDMFNASHESFDTIMEKINKYELQMETYDDFFRNLEHMKVT